MSKLLPALLFLFSFAYYSATAQSRVDKDFAFQTNPAKKYSIYAPSGYNSSTANKMMVGFHPFNVTRWDAKSWCDTLVAFAESNNLILVCPDGGTNGRVDDAIDFGFTTALIDSMKGWYNIENTKIFAMGFSVGGKATYEYGLANSSMFAGYIPIGAAINSGTFSTNAANAKDKPYFIVHGATDAASVRYTPAKNSLGTNGACVNDTLMPSVGHTIDFPNRNAILTMAFKWIDTVSCGSTVSINTKLRALKGVKVFPTTIKQGGQINISFDKATNASVKIYSMQGKWIYNSVESVTSSSATVTTVSISGQVASGMYYLHINNKLGEQGIYKFIVQ